MPLIIVRNDITKMKVDAIVNAAKSSLLGGGGVDGAIHKVAGPMLTKICGALGGCKTGQAKITKGYRLPCKYVIHTVGPVYRGGGSGEKELLSSCYRSSLEIAQAHGCETVAFPLISSGAYGYPKDQALKVAIDVISEFLLSHDMTVYIVIYDKQSYEISGKLFEGISQFIDDVYVGAHTDAAFERRREAQYRAEDTRVFAKFIKPSRAKKYSDTRSDAKISMLENPLAPEHTHASEISGLNDMLKQMDESFAQMLFRKIDERGMTDVECYKRANIDRKLFSKIKSNKGYQPSKPTVLAFAIALRLSLDETREMLMKAGFALSRSSKFDVIVEYFITHGVFDVNEVNVALFKFDQSLLGTF